MPFASSTWRCLLVDRLYVHANRVHKQGFTRRFHPKTARHRETTDGFDRLRRQLVRFSRERVVLRSRRNHRHAFLFRVNVDNFCRQRWCVLELAKVTRRQKRRHHCWRPPHTGKLPPALSCSESRNNRSTGRCLGTGACGLECCLEPKLQGMTPPPPTPPPPDRLEMPTMDSAAAAFACRPAALCLSMSCKFRISNSAPLLYQSKPPTGFWASFRYPSNIIPKTDKSSFRYTIQSISCPPEYPLNPQQAP